MPDPKQPGFKNIILHPHFVSGLDFSTVTHNGPYSVISSSWVRSGNRVTWAVLVPANSSGDVMLDLKEDQKIYCDGGVEKSKGGIYRKHIFSGTYVFVIE